MIPLKYNLHDAYKNDTYIPKKITLSKFVKVTNLQIGLEYVIKRYCKGDDFANIGAATNTNHEIFIATGITPTKWTSSIIYKMTRTNLTGSIISIDFIKQGASAVAKTLSTLDGSIEVASPLTGEFIPVPFIMGIEAGVYDFDVEVTIGELVETFVLGTVRVIQDKTNRT